MDSEQMIPEIITKSEEYLDFLAREERSEATIRQYAREIQAFCSYVGNEPLNKETVIRYKQKLQDKYKPSSVNTKLAALNGFFSFIGMPDVRVKQIKIQRSSFLKCDRELSKMDYMELVNTARGMGNEKLVLLLKTIGSTGIRVSELSFITVEAVKDREAHINLKGKHRTVLLPQKLCRMLESYIERCGIASGPVFLSCSGMPMSRTAIWRMMKRLSERAGIAKTKVFPHNLRHLFASCFYDSNRDIAHLADILGHSNINTTRIYITSSEFESRKKIERLNLI